MPLEYMQQEPPDVHEYYQCAACHEERHMDDMNHNKVCAWCLPEITCTECKQSVVNDVRLWLACYCTTREIGSFEDYPPSWETVYTKSGLTKHAMDATEEDCENCITWDKCIACPGSGLQNP